MSPYQFQTEDFALSEDGIHLLRNRFNYKTIEYKDVREARIERSAEIRNAPLILGAYCLYAVRRKGPILRLEAGSRVYKLRLRTAAKRKLTADLERYLGSRLGPAFRVDRSAL